MPPLFLQESGHSGGIPVDSGGMKFSRRPCQIIYSGVFHSSGIPVDSGIYTGMFPGIGRNRILVELFICLLCICDE